MFNIHKELERWTTEGDLGSLLDIIEKYLEEEGFSLEALEEIKAGLELKEKLLEQVEALRELACRIAEEVETVEDAVEHMP